MVQFIPLSYNGNNCNYMHDTDAGGEKTKILGKWLNFVNSSQIPSLTESWKHPWTWTTFPWIKTYIPPIHFTYAKNTWRQSYLPESDFRLKKFKYKNAYQPFKNQPPSLHEEKKKVSWTTILVKSHCATL